jgi:hypothetical protein
MYFSFPSFLFVQLTISATYDLFSDSTCTTYDDDWDDNSNPGDDSNAVEYSVVTCLSDSNAAALTAGSAIAAGIGLLLTAASSIALALVV